MSCQAKPLSSRQRQARQRLSPTPLLPRNFRAECALSLSHRIAPAAGDLSPLPGCTRCDRQTTPFQGCARCRLAVPLALNFSVLLFSLDKLGGGWKFYPNGELFAGAAASKILLLATTDLRLVVVSLVWAILVVT